MLNPFKSLESINNFYVTKDSNLPLNNNASRLTNMANKCKPNMDWIYNKCMMRSQEFRDMLENNNQAAIFIYDPLVKKDPYLKEKSKKRIQNSYDYLPYYDLSVMNPVFNQCALMYQEHCRNFYERMSLEEKFQIE